MQYKSGERILICFGKERRLGRIFPLSGKASIILPVDDSLLTGPESWLRDPQDLLSAIDTTLLNGVLGYRGFFRNYAREIHVPLIVNLTASTTMSTYTRKVLVSTVEDSVAHAADAVAVHVNIGSMYESEMLSLLGKVVMEASPLGMPVLAIMYPRTETADGISDYQDLRIADEAEYARIVRHAVRVGADLGADIVKTQFTGSADSFASVVEACRPVPVVVAGGPLVPIGDSLDMARNAVTAGAAGLSFGRNVFERDVPSDHLRSLREIANGVQLG